MSVYKFHIQGVAALVFVFASLLSSGCGRAASADCQSALTASPVLFDETVTSEETTPVAKQVFYVSSAAGDDQADGKTPRTAWRTIAKVNSTKFESGTQVLLRRGGIWREQLTVPASGDAAGQLVFGAYSNESSSAPVIAGSDEVGGWQPVSNGIYRARLEAEPANVYLDDQPAPLSRCKLLKDVQTTENSWYYDLPEKALYVRLANSESPLKHIVEAAVRDYNVYGNGKAHVKINGLELKHARLSAILAENDGAEFWTVSNCVIRNAAEAGVHARPVDREGAPLLRGWTIENNKIGRIEGGSGLDYDRAGILLRHVKDAVVRRNTVATVNKMGITLRDFYKAGGSEGGLVSGNRLTENQGNISIWMTPNAVVADNRIFKSKGYGIGIGVRSHNALIAYNSINFLRQSDDETLYNGIDVNADSQNGRIFHNTIVNVRGFNLTLEQSDAPCNGWVVKNNIFDAREAPFERHSNIAVDPLVVSFTFANNIYVPSRKLPNIVNHFHRKDMTMTEWTAATGDVGSMSADPLFVKIENDDLALANGSPARGKAARIAGINDGKPLNIGAR